MGAAGQPEWERRFVAALDTAERFFLGDARVQHAAREIAERLEKENIPYAIAGAMALNAHGYERVTSDVAVLLNPRRHLWADHFTWSADGTRIVGRMPAYVHVAGPKIEIANILFTDRAGVRHGAWIPVVLEGSYGYTVHVDDEVHEGAEIDVPLEVLIE